MPERQSESPILDTVFDHVHQLGLILRVGGYAGLAALIEGMVDMRQLSELGRAWPDAADERARYTLSYVMEQLSDLAVLMEQEGELETAVLLRLPAALIEARRVRLDRDGERDQA